MTFLSPPRSRQPRIEPRIAAVIRLGDAVGKVCITVGNHCCLWRRGAKGHKRMTRVYDRVLKTHRFRSYLGAGNAHISATY